MEQGLTLGLSDAVETSYMAHIKEEDLSKVAAAQPIASALLGVHGGLRSAIVPARVEGSANPATSETSPLRSRDRAARIVQGGCCLGSRSGPYC